MKPLHVGLITLAFLLTVATPAAARKWTDSTGKFSVEAELVEVKAGKVFLKKESGKVVSVSLDRLSAADRRYLETLNRPSDDTDSDSIDSDSTDSGSAETVAPPKLLPNQPLIEPTWTTRLSAMKPLDQPVSGKLHGQKFVPDKIKLSGGTLSLQEGDEIAFPPRKVSIFLFLDDDEDLRGKKLRYPASEGFGGPHVHMHYEKPDDNFGETEMFMDKIAMVLEFGQSSGGQLPVQLYLCLPDEEKSVVAGTFSVEVFDDTHPATTASKISGRVTVRGKPSGLNVMVGCYGNNSAGKLEGPGSGLELDGSTSWAKCLTWAPRFSSFAWDEDAGAGSHEHLNRVAGHYLVYAQGRATQDDSGGIMREGYYDWKWVQIESDGDQIEADLAIDPANAGSVEITASGAGDMDIVTYVPLDEDGELPLPDLLRYVQGTAGVKLAGGKATVQGLRPGVYRFAVVRRRQATPATPATVDVEVRRGETANVELDVTAAAAGN